MKGKTKIFKKPFFYICEITKCKEWFPQARLLILDHERARPLREFRLSAKALTFHLEVLIATTVSKASIKIWNCCSPLIRINHTKSITIVSFSFFTYHFDFFISNMENWRKLVTTLWLERDTGKTIQDIKHDISRNSTEAK